MEPPEHCQDPDFDSPRAQFGETPRLNFVDAVYQRAALFGQAIRGKGRAGAVAPQTLQACPVLCLNAHAGIDREATVLVGQRLQNGRKLGCHIAGTHDRPAALLTANRKI